MTELMNRDEFPARASERRSKGNTANKSAPCFGGLANGPSQPRAPRALGRESLSLVGPFADYLGYVYARTPDEYRARRRISLLQETCTRKRSGGRPPQPDLLIRVSPKPGQPPASGVERPRQHEPEPTRALQSWCYCVAMSRETRSSRVAGLVRRPRRPGAHRSLTAARHRRCATRYELQRTRKSESFDPYTSCHDGDPRWSGATKIRARAQQPDNGWRLQSRNASRSAASAPRCGCSNTTALWNDYVQRHHIAEEDAAAVLAA